MTRIKICGITREQDVSGAVELGVDALGFILAESPRHVSIDRAEELTRDIPPFISIVAVVSNPEEGELEEIYQRGIFSHIQFHGKEKPELLQKSPVKTIKAISIENERDLDKISCYEGADFILFDTKVSGKRGGTGKTFDWSLLKKINYPKSFILAGGLGPENIREALYRCRPAAVDLNSCIESEPGIKDYEKMKQAVTIIRKEQSNIFEEE